MFPLLFLVFFSCQNSTKESKVSETKTEIVIADTSYTWTKLLDSADWRKNYNFQMFSINDTLWTFHPDGTWLSTDGKRWAKSALSNSIYNLAFLDYVYFKGSVYGLGYFKGILKNLLLNLKSIKPTTLKLDNPLKDK